MDHGILPSLNIEEQKSSTDLSINNMMFRLKLVTWNVGVAAPPDDLSDLLGWKSETQGVDMYVIGLQEVNSKVLNFISDMAFDDPWSNFLMDALSLLGYVKISSLRMQGLLLLIFVKYCHIPFIRDIKSSYTRSGLYGYWGNKGGVAIRLSLYGHMICFLNCHLPAHMENANQRLDTFENILEMQQFPGTKSPSILDHDVLFWFGDLNFRIESHGIHFIREAIDGKRLHLLWDKDQLNIAKKKEKFLEGFEEGSLNFKPTYKFDLNSDLYDTSGKKRKPAWTDRILWRIKNVSHSSEKDTLATEQPIKVILENYSSHMTYSISDHKPLSGTFTLEYKKLDCKPMVTIQPEGVWSADHDVIVRYSTAEEFPSSSWDWIGLYKVGFRNPNDYMMYLWVKDDEIGFGEDFTQVYISAEEIPVQGGEFILCYYSNKMQSIAGISQPFQVQQSKTSQRLQTTHENFSTGNNTPNDISSHEYF
ncbi:inositol polyphosphate 5-phosphatase K isoform X2 [Protopterus annectens]|uniref:inositol polyphosphate 5-phosphatase K isoform X2 n=1 Tax=Protopterus annectens TaxID=7888 RepID=UPI001CF9DD14|nr:inositol polyphosphate 5-phosphatase K isoform X2 [Protopterus annectens]